jgi:hypothetical protein
MKVVQLLFMPELYKKQKCLSNQHQSRFTFPTHNLFNKKSFVKMNSFTMIFGLALIAVAAAHGHGSSYVKRHDDHGHHSVVHHGGESHGHGGESQGHGHGGESHHDYYHHPSYKFEYGVKDPKTKDHHSQWEHRDGDVVKGEYTLDEADGTKRVVKYTSDKKSGFNAVVERIGHAIHPQVHHHEHGSHH